MFFGFGGECVSRMLLNIITRSSSDMQLPETIGCWQHNFRLSNPVAFCVRRTRVATLSAVPKLTTRGFRRGGDALVRHVITQVFQNHGTVGERSLSQLIFTHRSSHLHRWPCSGSSLVRLPWIQGRAKKATSSFVNVFLMRFFCLTKYLS